MHDWQMVCGREFLPPAMNYRRISRMVSRLTKTWWVAFALGIEFLLALLIGAWLLRAVSPGAAAVSISVVETPVRRTAELEQSLDQIRDVETQLRAELARLQSNARVQNASCAAPALPADRWASKDLSLLSGCWLLGHEVGAVRGDLNTPEREENCMTRAGRICFDGKGGGQREQVMDCPISGRATCKAPISAKFNDDGTLSTNQPYVRCEGPPTYWHAYSLTCERVDNATALCHSSGFPGFPPRDYEFRREP